MRPVARLAVLVAFVALATSRLGLVAHELLGHGGMALAVGARILEVRLFWFAGGWIRYVGAPDLAAVLAISMAGIAVELAAGTALWLAARGDSLGRRVLRTIGAGLVLHATCISPPARLTGSATASCSIACSGRGACRSPWLQAW